MKSPILNGNFENWTHLEFFGIGDSLGLVDVGGYWADRWGHRGSGSKVNPSRQRFPVGQCVIPGNPRYFYRITTQSLTGSANYCLLAQDIPRCDSFSGLQTTFFFWAKADATKDICLEWQHAYGDGSPSGFDLCAGLTQKISLTTSWQLFKVPTPMPSCSGKTLALDDTDYVTCVFWLDAGSSFNTRCCNLGQQSGVFDFYGIGWLPGDLTGCDDPFALMDLSGDRADCLRFAQMSEGEDNLWSGWATTGYVNWTSVRFGVPMRKTPDYITLGNKWQSRFGTVGTVSSKTRFGFSEARQAISNGQGYFGSRWLADAEFPYTP